MTYQQDKKELCILDICFGLGYNTFATLYYLKKNNIDKKVTIYSPEFDLELLRSLESFIYPKEFEFLQNIINQLSNNLFYEDKNITIEIFNGDARKYIKKLSNINIVYQDPFSSDVNRSLWTKEYFEDIKNTLASDAIITTYSIATPVRLAMWENGLGIYEIENTNTNKSTIAFNKNEVDKRYKHINMQLKLQRNKKAKALSDFD